MTVSGMYGWKETPWIMCDLTEGIRYSCLEVHVWIFLEA